MLVSRSGAIDLEATRESPDGDRFSDVVLAADPIDVNDPFLYHKTTNRRVYEGAVAARPGMSDVLLYNQKNELTESTIANLIVDLDGELFTPPIECGLLAGTGRAQLLAEGKIRERKISIDEALSATRLFLVNSVRGMHPVSVTDPSLRPRPCKQPPDVS